MMCFASETKGQGHGSRGICCPRLWRGSQFIVFGVICFAVYRLSSNRFAVHRLWGICFAVHRLWSNLLRSSSSGWNQESEISNLLRSLSFGRNQSVICFRCRSRAVALSSSSGRNPKSEIKNPKSRKQFYKYLFETSQCSNKWLYFCVTDS